MEILQKDHGMGSISLVQEMERGSGKEKIRLLDQVRLKGKDNEVLARYHVPELEKEWDDLRRIRMFMEGEINYSHNEIEDLKREIDHIKTSEGLDELLEKAESKGNRKGFVKGMKSALKETLMHRVDAPTIKGYRGPICYSSDTMNLMHEDIMKHPGIYIYRTNRDKAITAKDIEGGDVDDFIRGIKNSRKKSRVRENIDR